MLRHIGGESVVSDGIADGDLLVTTSLEYPVAGMALKRFDERAAEVKSASSAASAQTSSAAKRDQGEQ